MGQWILKSRWNPFLKDPFGRLGRWDPLDRWDLFLSDPYTLLNRYHPLGLYGRSYPWPSISVDRGVRVVSEHMALEVLGGKGDRVEVDIHTDYSRTS